MDGSTTNGRKIFNGCYRHGVDDKRRVQVPAKWRPENGEAEFVLIIWRKYHFAPHLRVLPMQMMHELLAKINSLPDFEESKGALKRVIGSASENVTLDKGGRICLPEEMAQAVGITEEAVLVGCMDYFEIWAPEYYEKVRVLDESLMPKMFSLIP